MLADQNTFKEPLQTLYRMRNVSNDAEIDRLYEDYKKIENFWWDNFSQMGKNIN